MAIPAVSRFAAALASLLLVLGSACGGPAGAGEEDNSADLVQNTRNFVLVGIDAQATAPLFTCSNATSTVQVNGGTLAVSGTAYTPTFKGTATQSGATSPQTYQNKGQVSASGNSSAFSSTAGAFTGTSNDSTLTVAGVSYCGATHTLIYRQQWKQIGDSTCVPRSRPPANPVPSEDRRSRDLPHRGNRTLRVCHFAIDERPYTEGIRSLSPLTASALPSIQTPVLGTISWFSSSNRLPIGFLAQLDHVPSLTLLPCSCCYE